MHPTAFVWTIQDAGFDTLTATESHGFLLPNSITVPGATTILYVAPLNGVTLSVAAITPKALANLDDVRYVVTGGATPAAGDFNPTPVITVGAAGVVHVVTAWLDENSNSLIDGGEFSLSLTIQVVNFGSAKVFGARVPGGVLHPGEDLLFIKAGELFDVTSTFEYKLIPQPDTALGPGAIVRGQLIRPSTGSVFASSGTIGESFSVLLTSAMVGPAQVRFYLDANFNGTWDTGELVRTSSPFEIVERNHLTRTYQYNIYFPVSQADVQSAVDASLELALRKDSDDDWRAAVFTTMTPAPTVYFVPGIPRHDPTTSVAMIRAEHFDEHDGLTILSGMTDITLGTLLGYARFNSNALVIDWNLKAVDTIVHELGHNLNLVHNGLGANYIMEAVIVGSNDHLTYSESMAFSAISTSPSTPGAGPKLTTDGKATPSPAQLSRVPASPNAVQIKFLTLTSDTVELNVRRPDILDRQRTVAVVFLPAMNRHDLTALNWNRWATKGNEEMLVNKISVCLGVVPTIADGVLIEDLGMVPLLG